MSKQIIWSNTSPSGRSYREHLKGITDDGFGEEHRNNRLTLQRALLAAGGGPIRTHSALAALLDVLEVGYSIDDSLPEGTCVVGTERTMLRVTGLYA